MSIMTDYTTAELEAMPTLSVGWTADLKVNTGTERVWLERTTVADGEPYDNKVTHERFDGSCWVTVAEYPGNEA